MKKTLLKSFFTGVLTLGLMSSCGEDRTGEYLALVGTQMWMYQTMQDNYLYYEDLPTSDKELNFFRKPQEFLESLISSKDQKNGYKFSHVDSVYVQPESRADMRPSFGMECAVVRIPNGSEALRVLYTQKDSPAEEVNLKRGDWIIAADGKKINTNSYAKYVARPTEACNFTLASFNGKDFDTLQVVQMPSPRAVVQDNILDSHIIDSENRKAFYILYNEFGNDEQQLKELFTQIAGEQVDDIILDLRYNPGGYVLTSQIMAANLAPAEAIDKPFLKMISNDKVNKNEVLTLDASLMNGGTPLSYQNLYVITSGNTASASEVVINGLKPYMKGRLLQVGAPTFGKNVAQSLFTNEQSPMVEFWLTTHQLANSEDFGDYFTNGLQPDYQINENLADELGEFGTPSDNLMTPILHHMANGAFPQEEGNEDKPANVSRTTGTNVLYHPIANKPKWLKLTEGIRK